VRAEEILPGHPLVAFLRALQRDGLVTEFLLGPLTTTETTSLAEHIMGQQLDPAMSNTLYHETEGNPLFVVEMAYAGTLGQHEEQTLLPEAHSRCSHALPQPFRPWCRPCSRHGSRNFPHWHMKWQTWLP